MLTNNEKLARMGGWPKLLLEWLQNCNACGLSGQAIDAMPLMPGVYVIYFKNATNDLRAALVTSEEENTCVFHPMGSDGVFPTRNKVEFTTMDLANPKADPKIIMQYIANAMQFDW